MARRAHGVKPRLSSEASVPCVSGPKRHTCSPSKKWFIVRMSVVLPTALAPSSTMCARACPAPPSFFLDPSASAAKSCRISGLSLAWSARALAARARSSKATLPPSGSGRTSTGRLPHPPMARARRPPRARAPQRRPTLRSARSQKWPLVASARHIPIRQVPLRKWEAQEASLACNIGARDPCPNEGGVWGRHEVSHTISWSNFQFRSMTSGITRQDDVGV